MEIHLMPQNTDDFIKKVAHPTRRPTIYAVGEFIIHHKGKDIEEVAQKYIEIGKSKSSLSMFANSLSWRIEIDIGTEIPGLIASSRDELIKRAEENRIYLTKNAGEIFGSNEDNWFLKQPKIDGVSELSRNKRIFSWINCLTEFYCEESLFRTTNPKHSISLRQKGEHPVSFKELQRAMSVNVTSKKNNPSANSRESAAEQQHKSQPLQGVEDFYQSQSDHYPSSKPISEGGEILNTDTKNQEETLLKELWEKGYLKCDLVR
jgi:hypothetical protein